MSFEEFLMANGDEKSLEILRNFKVGSTIAEIIHEHLWDMLKRYFVVGGLPEVVSCYLKHKENLFLALSEVRGKQDDLIKAYYGQGYTNV